MRRPVIHPRADLYLSPDGMFVAPDLDDPMQWWSWPRGRETWTARVPWTGERSALKGRDVTTAFSTGWPGARAEVPEPRPPRKRGPRARAPETVRSQRIQALVSPDLATRIDRLAARAGTTISTWVEIALVKAVEDREFEIGALDREP